MFRLYAAPFVSRFVHTLHLAGMALIIFADSKKKLKER